MPHETIHVAVYKAAPAEAVSLLMSFIAYPDPSHKIKRELFERSLYRMALIYRAESDKAWGQSVQKIKPSVLLEEEKVFLASLKRGTKLLGRHMLTSYTFLMPHIIALSTGSPAPTLNILDPTAEGFDKNDVPTVEKMSFLVMQTLGWKSEESDTFEKNIWAIVKPIVHLGYAMASWLAIEARVAKTRNRDSSNLFFELFFDETLPVYIHMAEGTRNKLSLIKKPFEIKVDDTIQFIAV
jgi:hypothetical protein